MMLHRYVLTSATRVGTNMTLITRKYQSTNEKQAGYKTKMLKNISEGSKRLEEKIEGRMKDTIEGFILKPQKINHRKPKGLGQRLALAINNTEHFLTHYFLTLVPSIDNEKPETRAARSKRASEVNALLRSEANQINSIVRSGASVEALDFMLHSIDEEHDVFTPTRTSSYKTLQPISYKVTRQEKVKPVIF